MDDATVVDWPFDYRHTNSSEVRSFDALARDGVKTCQRQSVRACAGRTAVPSGKVIETPCRNEHGAAVARSGKRDDARDLLAPVYGWFTEARSICRRRRR